MSNENSNDLSWKDKLEDVNNLPGEVLADKNTAWEKLASRLYKKPVPRRLAWYLAVAACLLPILVTLVIVNKRQNVEITNDHIHIIPNKPTVSRIAPLKQASQVNRSAGLMAKKESIKKAGQTVGRKYISNHLVENKVTTLAIRGDQKEMRLVQTIPELPVLVAPPVNNPEVALGRKLKVVHINELGDPVPETGNTVHAQGYWSLHPRFVNPEVFISSSLPSGNTSFNIFKTRNTPPN